MKVSEIVAVTSASYSWVHVWQEIVELFLVTNWEECKDEFRDVVTTAALWIHLKTGADFHLPSWASSAPKYFGRLEICRGILEEEGLFDVDRSQAEPWYWAQYTTAGSNMEKAHKLEIFLANAREDLR